MALKNFFKKDSFLESGRDKSEKYLSRTGGENIRHFVYLLECSDHTLYTGWSTDPKRREKVHNSGKGAKYTRSRLPVHLVYTEFCQSRSDALKREAEIKQLSRAEKEILIASGRCEKNAGSNTY